MHTVLIPPMLCSARVYSPLVDAVWQHGTVSIADTRSDNSHAAMAARILRETPGEVVVLGTSMGGYVALELVRQAPHRVSALVLVSTTARPDTEQQGESRRNQSAMVEGGAFDAFVDAAFPGVVAVQHENDASLLQHWRAMAQVVGAEAFLRQQTAVMTRVDSRPLLPTLTCPTLVVHGADDRLIPSETSVEIAKATPNSRLTLIEDAGHFLFGEQPAATAAAIAEFLAEVHASIHR
jgi:pimeloyl-ACP methyl ester carboxylesterase